MIDSLSDWDPNVFSVAMIIHKIIRTDSSLEIL